MTQIIPSSPFPIPQWAWDTPPTATPYPTLIQKLNIRLQLLQQVVQAMRTCVQGPVWNISTVTASRNLTLTDSTLLVNTTGGAVALTLPVSTTVGCFGK